MTLLNDDHYIPPFSPIVPRDKVTQNHILIVCQVLITETVDVEAASFIVWVFPFPSLFLCCFVLG